MNGHSAKCEWLSLCKLGRNLNSPLRSVKQFGGALLWYAQLITLLFCKWIVMFLNDPLRHSLESVWQLCVCVRVCWWSVCRADCWPALQSSLMCVWVRAVSVCQPSTKTERKNGRTKKQNNQCVCVCLCVYVCVRLWSAVFFLYCWPSLPWKHWCQMGWDLCLGIDVARNSSYFSVDSNYTPKDSCLYCSRNAHIYCHFGSEVLTVAKSKSLWACRI